MLFLLASALIGAGAPLSPGAASGLTQANHNCRPILRYQVRGPSGRAELHRLNELPPADAYKAVYRTVDGCIAPVIVRYGLGQK